MAEIRMDILVKEAVENDTAGDEVSYSDNMDARR